MSVATVASRALAGIDAPDVTVEVHLGPALPAFVSPNVMKVLQDKFDLKPIGQDAEADLALMLN